MNFLGFLDELKSNWVVRKSPQRIKQAFLLLIASACLALLPSLLIAHEIRPAIATFAMQPNCNYSITISLNLEAILSGIGAEHEDTDDSPNAERYNQLRELSSQDLNSQFQGFQFCSVPYQFQICILQFLSFCWVGDGYRVYERFRVTI